MLHDFVERLGIAWNCESCQKTCISVSERAALEQKMQPVQLGL